MNNSDMLVMKPVSHFGMSVQPAAPHRGGLSGLSSVLAQFGSVEQQFSPEGTLVRQLTTAALSASFSANGVASALGTLENVARMNTPKK